MEPAYRLVVDDQPDLVELARLEDEVAAAAIAAAGDGPDRQFGIFIRDDADVVVAGLAGMSWSGFCELHAMWVDPAWRGRGLARALMAEAEAEARRRRCRLIHFFAYDLLAADLYERLGYRTVGVIDDCPRGSAARWYCKELISP